MDKSINNLVAIFQPKTKNENLKSFLKNYNLQLQQIPINPDSSSFQLRIEDRNWSIIHAMLFAITACAPFVNFINSLYTATRDLSFDSQKFPVLYELVRFSNFFKNKINGVEDNTETTELDSYNILVSIANDIVDEDELFLYILVQLETEISQQLELEATSKNKVSTFFSRCCCRNQIDPVNGDIELGIIQPRASTAKTTISKNSLICSIFGIGLTNGNNYKETVLCIKLNLTTTLNGSTLENAISDHFTNMNHGLESIIINHLPVVFVIAVKMASECSAAKFDHLTNLFIHKVLSPKAATEERMYKLVSVLTQCQTEKEQHVYATKVKIADVTINSHEEIAKTK